LPRGAVRLGDYKLRYFYKTGTAKLYNIRKDPGEKQDLSASDLPNVVGMKYTGMDFYSVQQLVRLLDRELILFSGFDEQAVVSPAFGFNGSIGTTQNAAPKQFADIYALQGSGRIDEAAEIQKKVNEVIYLINETENRSYQKALMRYIGLDCGYFRPPFAPLTENEYQTFATKLESLDVLKRAD
jgi:N-acetylneuraminate lyase